MNELEPVDPENFIKRAKFLAVLEVFEQVQSVKETCRQTGITYQTWKAWKKDSMFQELLEERQEDIAARLEGEAFRRAVDGDEEDVYFKGEIVGKKKKKSDYLLVNLLQANLPEKYRSNVSVDQTGEMKLTHQGVIEQLQNVRLELSSDPKFLEYAYQGEAPTDSQPGLLCSGGDAEPVQDQQPFEADRP